MELTVPASAADPDFVGSPDPVSDADGSEADADAEVTDPDADDIVELDVPLERLAMADEAFLTSSTRDVQAIRAVDGVVLPACPGPWTQRAAAAFAALAAEDLDP